MCHARGSLTKVCAGAPQQFVWAMRKTALANVNHLDTMINRDVSVSAARARGPDGTVQELAAETERVDVAKWGNPWFPVWTS